MTPTLLAIDVGGSTSRAYLVDEAGRCLGQGRNLGGNPASNTPEQAASAIIAAVEEAVDRSGLQQIRIGVALIALAGPRAHVAESRLEDAFRRLGLTGPIVFTGDLNALLASVTASPDGYCLVAGTGAGAVRIRGGRLERIVDAAGWLLGDLGSGYWLGHRAAMAVAAELDGRGERTALTPAVLDALAIERVDARSADSRPLDLRRFIDAVYARRPIELARFAPIVIANRDDPVAARLLDEAEGYLVADFEMIFDPTMPGPVALGGGIIAHLTGLPAALGDVIARAGHTSDIRLAADGSVGAIALALRAIGRTVDDTMLRDISVSLKAQDGKQAGA